MIQITAEDLVRRQNRRALRCTTIKPDKNQIQNEAKEAFHRKPYYMLDKPNKTDR